jgi:hypothetical protein
MRPGTAPRIRLASGSPRPSECVWFDTHPREVADPLIGVRKVRVFVQVHLLFFDGADDSLGIGILGRLADRPDPAQSTTKVISPFL